MLQGDEHMRTFKRLLPEGVRRKFETTIGRKVRIVNTLYLKKPAKKSK
jgi:hypothetical protein